MRYDVIAGWADRQGPRLRAGQVAQGLSDLLWRDPLGRFVLYKALNGPRALNSRQMRKRLGRWQLRLFSAAGQREGGLASVQR